MVKEVPLNENNMITAEAVAEKIEDVQQGDGKAAQADHDRSLRLSVRQ